MLKEEASQSSRNSVSSGSGPVVMTACHLQCGRNFSAKKHWAGSPEDHQPWAGDSTLWEVSAERGATTRLQDGWEVR